MGAALKLKLHNLQEYPPPSLSSASTPPTIQIWFLPVCRPLHMNVLRISNHLASNKAHCSFFSKWPIPYLVLRFLSLILAAPSTQSFRLDALCIFHPLFQIHLFMKPYPRPPWTSFPLDCCNDLLAGLPASSLSSNSSSHSQWVIFLKHIITASRSKTAWALELEVVGLNLGSTKNEALHKLFHGSMPQSLHLLYGNSTPFTGWL